MDKKDSKTILLASDHNGNAARAYLVDGLLSAGYNVVDMGPADDGSVDYTLYAFNLSNAIQKNRSLCGVLICGTGIGMSIAANRRDGVRASLVHDVDEAKKTREHNDSNVIVFGAWKTTQEDMLQMTLVWLDEDFGKGRHLKRVSALSSEKDKIVAVPGVFEFVHPGHVRLLQFASTLGNVVVLLNSDDSALDVKGRRPFFSFEWRQDVVLSTKFVDEVVCLSDSVGSIARDIGVDIIVKGDVGMSEEEIRKIDDIDADCKIMLYPYVKGCSSIDIRKRLAK